MKEKIFKKGIKKRLFSVVLALAMVVALIQMNRVPVYAYSSAEMCSCGHNYGYHPSAKKCQKYKCECNAFDLLASGPTMGPCRYCGDPVSSHIKKYDDCERAITSDTDKIHGCDGECEGGCVGYTWAECVVSAHTHTWAYSVENSSKLVAACTCKEGDEGYDSCAYKAKTGNDRKVTLTLTASDANYSGSSGSSTPVTFTKANQGTLSTANLGTATNWTYNETAYEVYNGFIPFTSNSSWNDAMGYVAALNTAKYDGHDDWTLLNSQAMANAWYGKYSGVNRGGLDYLWSSVAKAEDTAYCLTYDNDGDWYVRSKSTANQLFGFVLLRPASSSTGDKIVTVGTDTQRTAWKAALGDDSIPEVHYVGKAGSSTTLLDTTTEPTTKGHYTASISAGDPVATATVNFDIVDKHSHSFTYAANGATLTATCGTSGDLVEACDLTDKKVSLTLTASSANYSGISGLDDFNTATGKTISTSDVEIYKVDAADTTTGGTKVTGTPSEDGYYYAKLTVETATAVKAFTVGTPSPAPSVTIDECPICHHSAAEHISQRVNPSGGYFPINNDDDKLYYCNTCGMWGTSHDNKKTWWDITHPHTHTNHYGVATTNTTNDTLTWYCGEDGCGSTATSENPIKLTLTASSANYSGNAVEASFVEADKTAWEAAGLTTPTITYEAKSGSSLTSNEAKNAGSYTAKATVTVDQNTYTATKDFTISPAALTITGATVADKTYDGATTANVTGVTFSGLQNSETLTKDTDYTVTGAFDHADATGTNAATKVTVTVTLSNGNYSLATNTYDVTKTISKATPTYTAPTGLTSYVGKTLADVNLPTGFTWVEAGTTSVGSVGSNTFHVKYTPTDTANYNVVESIEVTIAVSAKQSQTLTFANATVTKTYGDAAFTATATGANTAVTYSSGNTNVATVNSTTGHVTIVGAGTATITATAAEDATYAQGTASYTLTVNKASITPTVSLSGWTYGATANNPSVTGNTGNGTVTYTYKVKDAADITYSSAKPSNAGSYTVKASIAETTNYAAATATADFTITKASITPTVSLNGWTYGATANNPSVTGNTGNGTVTYTYKVKDAADSTYSSAKPSNAGSYTVKASVAATANYAEATATTDFTISKANSTLAAPTAKTLTYTATAQALVNAGTNVVGGTLQYSTTETGTYSATIPTGTNAGSYSVWYKVVGDANHNDTTAAKVDVTIAKATPTITTNPTASTITYGQTLADSALTGGVASTDGSFAWKAPTTAPAVADSNTTNYTVVFTPTDTANYNTVEFSVTLTVNKKPVAASIAITAPKAKETAQTEFAETADFEAATITWSPELKDGKFGYSKEYIATVTLTLKDAANTTTDGVTFTVAGAKEGGVAFAEGTLTVAFVKTSSAPSSGGSSSSITNSITAPASAEHGKASVDKQSASAGDTVTITVTPDKGYTLETLTLKDSKGNEVALTRVNDTTYTFKMPSSKVEINVTFMEDNSMLNFFVDIPVSEYYYDAVLWAAKNGIAQGTDVVHFDPDGLTTRAQVVTFLWRAAGCPTPKGNASKFTDIVAGEYYETAVAWAVENGITNGATATTFSPDAECTRAQVVTFLYRFNGVNTLNIKDNPFSDVPEGKFYYNAVLWAAENGVTSGTSATTFSPASNCLRGQVVTFLYRLLVK